MGDFTRPEQTPLWSWVFCGSYPEPAMQSRREFVRYAAMLTGGAGGLGAVGAVGAAGGIAEAILRAAAIEPEAGSTFLDAEHIVVLMQENRSFDHCFGMLRGVRGFSDPRAMTLADGSPVWAQPNARGERYGPFRLDLKGTKITWMGSLPHGWPDQVDAAAGGRHDGWLEAKRSGERAYREIPLTMGYYTREDLPFYYALADAFTVCDQNFCSSLTGTTPNRLYLWTGTCRDPRGGAGGYARVLNSDTDYGAEASWTTLPERLEEAGLAWRIYQNEISLGTGLSGEADAWLCSFTDNPIEWFSQFRVRFSETRRAYVVRRISEIPGDRQFAKVRIGDKEKLAKRLKELESELEALKVEAAAYTSDSWAGLPERDKTLHRRAFATNSGDPAYRELAVHEYDDGGTTRKVEVPKGDTLHQFRKDVEEGRLPAVSWLVPPERFSDHPSSPWYGAWYLAEVMNILTKNPEVWRKTIFVLTYDENDGLFDHVPPFQAPDPRDPATGRVSAGIDVAGEFVTMEEERARKKPAECRSNSIGLGFRVPMIVASPWSRGGAVCSQVFDHTSVVRLIEQVMSRRAGRPIRETNISAWRRAVCGDMSSVFRAAGEDPGSSPAFVERDEFIEQIHRAGFRGMPGGYRALRAEEVATGGVPALPKQEPGTRPSCPLPYELEVNGRASGLGKSFEITMIAGGSLFGERSSGAAFLAHSYERGGGLKVRNYAVAAGESVKDSWAASEGETLRLAVRGPNGFLREFIRPHDAVRVEVEIASTPKAGRTWVGVEVRNLHGKPVEVVVADLSYGGLAQKRTVEAGAATFRVETSASGGWYDFSVAVAGGVTVHAAGRVETGAWSTSDPAMGRA